MTLPPWLVERVRNEQQLPLSQDNYFHSVAGMLQPDTVIYNPDLDIFAPCRGNPVAKHAVAPKNASTGKQG